MAAPKNADIQQKILNSAATLMGSASFAEISLADIARETGISKGTLYYYYNSKDDILFDIAQRYLSQLSDSLLAWVNDPQKDTSFTRLARYTLQNGVFDKSGNLRLYLISAAISGNEELRLRIIGRYEYFQKVLADAISERLPDKDARRTAWSILLMMDGLLVQSQLRNPLLCIEEFIEDTVQKM